MKIFDNPICKFCNSIDSITHFYLFCTKTREFWKYFFNWWNRISNIKISNECLELDESIIFGFQIMEEEFKVLNYCILYAKFYIYKHKIWGDNEIHLYEYLCELKVAIKIEKFINIKNGTMKHFSKFNHILENL